MNTSISLPSRSEYVAPALAALALAGCLVTFTGWVFDLPRLADWDMDDVAQMPNNAIAVGAAAAGLICAVMGRHRMARALGAFAAVVAVATLFEHVSGVDLGIDTLIVSRPWGQRATVAPGRMGPPASVAIAVLGCSIIFETIPRLRGLAITGGLISIAVASLSLIGYLFGADPLFMIPRFTAIALQTSVMLLILGLALVSAVPERMPMRLLIGDSGVTMLVRRALPLLVALPIFAGGMLLYGRHHGLFDVAFGTALLVLTLVALLVALLLWAAAAISRHEAAMLESRDRLAAILQTVRESEQKFSLLFEKAAFGAALATLPDGRLVDVNETFVKMFGYSRDEAVGRTSVDLGINADGKLRASTVDQLQREGTIRDLELKLRTRSGEERVFVNNITIVELGGVRHLLTTIQDITERQAAEEALRRSTEALLVADRMKDEFLATLSHELRTPLTAIVGWASLLLDGNVIGREQERALDIIRSSAKTQAQLIDDVLDVSRIITGKMRLSRADADIAAVVEAAAAAVRPAAEAKSIELRLRIEGPLPRLYVDAERIRQVVWNLLSNSIKFSEPRTEVEVAVRAVEGSCVIEVTDQGPGISRDFLPHVFERFRQADSSTTRSHSGLGIGLALSKDLVELHGGTITAESEDGRGSRFTVRLPLRSGRKAGEASSPDNDSTMTLEGVRVLFVDDREDARHLIGTMLRVYGADVTLASSVEDALQALDRLPPDVVITDLAMPDHDGYELLSTMRSSSRWNSVPVLALTAQGRGDDELRASRAGFRALLRKPIEAQQLVTAVAQAATERQLQN